MSGIIEEAGDLAAEGVEDALHLGAEALGAAEGVFRPRPGGKIDTARRNAERDSLEDEPAGRTDTLIHGKPVAVDALVPEIGTARTVTLSAANPSLPVLPRDTTRRSAVILAVDNDVYLSADPGAVMTAANSGGATADGVFYLPAGIGIPWQNTDQLWAGATTTATSSRVSVMASFKGAQ
jgi:hypothetical protein